MDVWNLYRSDQQGLITHLSSRLFGPFKQTDQDFKSRNGSEAWAGCVWALCSIPLTSPCFHLGSSLLMQCLNFCLHSLSLFHKFPSLHNGCWVDTIPQRCFCSPVWNSGWMNRGQLLRWTHGWTVETVWWAKMFERGLCGNDNGRRDPTVKIFIYQHKRCRWGSDSSVNQRKDRCSLVKGKCGEKTQVSQMTLQGLWTLK